MNSGETPVLVASGLGWPEGPTVRPDGSVVFVESYRSQLTVAEVGGETRRFAYTAGAPNACVLGGDGALYVCQNGGTVGPWRAAEMTAPSIQRVREGGAAEILVTEIAGIALNGPNDLVFHADGRLIFTDPGTYNPADPDPSYIFSIAPDGSTSLLVDFSEPVFPNGVAVEADGSIVWDESYTGHVGRLRPDGTKEDFGRMPGDNPISGRHDRRRRRPPLRDRPRRRRDARAQTRRHGGWLHRLRWGADELRLRWRDDVGDRRRRSRRERRAKL